MSCVKPQILPPLGDWAVWQRRREAIHTAAGMFKRAGIDGEQLLRDLDRGRGLRYDDVRVMIREAKPRAAASRVRGRPPLRTGERRQRAVHCGPRRVRGGTARSTCTA